MGKLLYFKGEKQMNDSLTIFDVARVFLYFESMTHKKLQKLCYYAQAWYIALHNGNKLFDSTFEAWVHGPVCRELYNEYKIYGWDNIPKEDNVPLNVDENIYDFLKIVFDTYGDFSGDELEELSHSELPWQEARKGLEEWEPSNRFINEDTMRKFYWNIYEQSQND
jgi:uncharacterized phage-associated protein